MDFSLLRVRAAWLLLGMPLAASAGLSFDETTRLAHEQAPALQPIRLSPGCPTRCSKFGKTDRRHPRSALRCRVLQAELQQWVESAISPSQEAGIRCLVDAIHCSDAGSAYGRSAAASTKSATACHPTRN